MSQDTLAEIQQVLRIESDAIDAVYKAAHKDYGTAQAAVRKLLSDLATYKTAIKPKNPNLVTWSGARRTSPMT